MFELRWLTENWEEYPDDCYFPVKKESEPRLQYRTKEHVMTGGYINQVWTDWIDVPSLHVDI